MTFFYNPENIPMRLGYGDPRVQALYLREDARVEVLNQIFEDILRETSNLWSSVPGSVLIVRYAGRTNATCGDITDGITLVCWRNEPDYFRRPDGSMATATTDLRIDPNTGFIREGEIYLNPIQFNGTLENFQLTAPSSFPAGVAK